MTLDASDLQRDFERWRKDVAGVLVKTTRRAAEDLPAEPERLLDSQTYDGIAIRPLYTALDELPESALPGQWPYTRGADPRRDVNSGWKVAERFTGDDPATINEAVLEALALGTSAVVLAVRPEQIARALQGVYLDLAPVALEAGDDVVAVADAVTTLLDTIPADNACIDLGADPLTASLSGRDTAALDDVVALAVRLAARPETIRAITVDGPAAHEQGASDSTELAVAIAAGVAYLRMLLAAGLDTAQALGQISFRLAATDDQFLTLAKFRAIRVLWARVADVAGAPAAGGAVVHAVTSEPMMAQRDPWVNMLRTTLAAFGAGAGGADTVRVRPFDDAIPGGLGSASPAFSARIARNTQLLLIEESHVGRVLDPAGGSWYVEDLTESLAQQAWSLFTEIEERGGFTAAQDLITERIAATRSQRDSDIAHRRTSITGVNEFANLAEVPLPKHAPGGYRYAGGFETLRDRSDLYLAARGMRPKVLLLPLGPLAEHNVRTTFAANLLASGGIEAVYPGSVNADGVAAAVRQSDAPLAVLCGTDVRYAAEVGAVVDAGRAAGLREIYLAGPQRAVRDIPESSRPDGYLIVTMNAVEALSAMLTTLGA